MHDLYPRADTTLSACGPPHRRRTASVGSRELAAVSATVPEPRTLELSPDTGLPPGARGAPDQGRTPKGWGRPIARGRSLPKGPPAGRTHFAQRRPLPAGQLDGHALAMLHWPPRLAEKRGRTLDGHTAVVGRVPLAGRRAARSSRAQKTFGLSLQALITAVWRGASLAGLIRTG